MDLFLVTVFMSHSCTTTNNIHHNNCIFVLVFVELGSFCLLTTCNNYCGFWHVQCWDKVSERKYVLKEIHIHTHCEGNDDDTNQQVSVPAAGAGGM